MEGRACTIEALTSALDASTRTCLNEFTHKPLYTRVFEAPKTHAMEGARAYEIRMPSKHTETEE